jgi:hypothetical protein
LYEQENRKSILFSKKRYDKTTVFSVTLSCCRNKAWRSRKRLRVISVKALSDKASGNCFRAGDRVAGYAKTISAWKAIRKKSEIGEVKNTPPVTKSGITRDVT